MRLRSLLAFFLFFLSCFPCYLSSQAGNLSSDAAALLSFKNTLSPASANTIAELASWKASSTSTLCSSWYGISCSNASNQTRVSAVRLPGKSLYGVIAAGTLDKLDRLDTLSLHSNKLSGGFPPGFSNLSSLRKLFLQRNTLSGPLPSDFSPWPLLSQLDLSFNSFSGAIPSSIGNLKHLRSLSLENNSFDGAIPQLDSSTLQTFNVANNDLNGSIPAVLARFPASSFTGNVNLCGVPLQACGGSPPSPSKRDRLSKGAIIGISCAAAVAAILLLLLLCFVCIRRRNREGTVATRSVEGNTREIGLAAAAASASDEAKRESSAASGKEGEERNKLVFINEEKLFDLEDLLRASAEVLGKGTLGTSYKAVLEDGLIVTVKRLRDIDDNRRDEYRHRINAIGRLKHDNLVQLRAYYLDKEENLLVYDFMQNGSLSALLHGSRGAGNPLDWETRVRIAATSAKALSFLHSYDMVHGNVKASNVLLKSNLEACLADYGLSQMVSFTPGGQKAVGYQAPEVVVDPQKVTPESDVFSYGVLLLELLTGKVPLVPTNPNTATAVSPLSAPGPSTSPSRGPGADDAVDLPRWVQSVVREEWTAEVFDPLLMRSGQPLNEEEMVQLLQIAMPCVAPSPDQRPSMLEVVQRIDNMRRATDDDKSSDSYPEQYAGTTSRNP